MLDEPGQPNPEQLLERARTGDVAAVGELLQFYRPYLSLLARLKADRKLSAKLDDSDLVQDTCLSAHRDFIQFRGSTEREFTAWLREIMAHAAANMVRNQQRQRRDVRLEQQLSVQLNESSQMIERALIHPASSPSHSAIRRERAVLLANAMSRLPADYREVLVLRELEGKSLSEVAQRMGRTSDAVHKLWARALVQMRRLMESSLESS